MSSILIFGSKNNVASSNGRIRDFESLNLGSNPSVTTKKEKMFKVTEIKVKYNREYFDFQWTVDYGFGENSLNQFNQMDEFLQKLVSKALHNFLLQCDGFKN